MCVRERERKRVRERESEKIVFVRLNFINIRFGEDLDKKSVYLTDILTPNWKLCAYIIEIDTNLCK